MLAARAIFLVLGALGAQARPKPQEAGDMATVSNDLPSGTATVSNDLPSGTATVNNDLPSGTAVAPIHTSAVVSGTGSGATGVVPGGGNGTAPTTTIVAPAVPSSPFPANMTVPGQDNLPEPQWWCNNGGDGTYCPGALLQAVQLAEIFPDSKTFSDKPTVGTLNETMAAFNALGSNVTVGQVSEFVTKYFKPERQELEAVAIEGFVENPAILNNISDPIYKAWTGKVNSYWELLIRQTNQSALCQPGQCESSLIPLNHTIVVPGGRYGEIYYWDSFWILEGLLASELYHYAWNLLQNMFDMVEEYGFVPNGGRKYYLNRSQPPVLTQMVAAYVRATGNVTVLERGLPLLHQELEWFQTNRTLLVTSPYSNVTHRVARWAVNNTAPRPEGYIEDYEAANKADPPLNASQRADLYAELASGAESGWDYTGRWAKELILNKTDNLPILRTLNVRGIVPVDLTALLAGDHSTLAGLYEVYQAAQKNGSAGGGGENLNPNVTAPAKPTAFTSCVGAASGGGSPGGGVAPADGKCGVPESSNSTTKPPVTEDGDKIMYHRAMAANYSAAVTDLHWDPVKAFWYDFNMTSMTRSDVFTPAGLWPLWLNVTPPALLQNETLGLQVASGLRFLLGQYPGSPSVSSLLDTGLNWDFPNVWPPHAYTTIKAMENLGRLIPMASSLSSLALTSFSEVAPGQFGMNVTELPTAALDTLGNSTSNSTSMPNDVNNSTASGSNATAIDVGAAESNATAPGSNSTAPGSNMTAPGSNVTAPGSNSTGDLPWPKALAIEIASRYMTAAFCSWYSTGGALPGILAQLPLAELNATGTYKGDEGHMFEKFDVTDIDAAGGGGEYEVVTGFGWTNGVVLWAAGQYGQYLPAPACPQIAITSSNGTNTGPTTPTASNATVGVVTSGAAAISSATATSAIAVPISTESAASGDAPLFEGHRRR